MRPSHTTIVAYLALFLAMGGTATAVTYVVSSNSQLGPGTVSGSKPTTGKHDNIINGTVNGADVAGNSLGGADINESKLASVPDSNNLGGHPASFFGRIIPFGKTNFTGTVSLAVVDGLTIKSECDTTFHTFTIIFLPDSPSTVNLFHVDSAEHLYEDGMALDGQGMVDGIGAGERIEGQAIYRRDSDGAVVTVIYHLYEPSCEISGTALAGA